MTRKGRVLTATLLLAGAATISVEAVKQPDRAVDSLLYTKPETIMRPNYVSASEIADLSGDSRFVELGVRPELTKVDSVSGRLATLLPSTPLLPGRGVGNSLAWAGSAPADPIALEQAATVAFRGWLESHAAALGVDFGELAWPGKVTALSDAHVNIYIPRHVGGIEVRNNALGAVIRHGNLILVGTENWADFDGVGIPVLTSEDAQEVLRRHVGERLFGSPLKAPRLEYIPVRLSVGGEESITYRLAWVIQNDLRQTGGDFEAVVDAANGELLVLEDRHHYVAAPRRAQGGVYPVSNDQTPPDGVEQTGWPMPFSFLTAGPTTLVTDIGGNAPLCIDGNATARLSGPFIDMNDNCGAESLTSSADNIDWLSGPNPTSTDCTTPGVGGAGNTKSSRSGFHELNMIKAMARSHLPNNTWLQQQLTANMNVSGTCNANWTGTVVNFFPSALPNCRNTGEIAGVFDHEWGHGMDNNDAVPSIANPGEGIADIYSTLRLNDSCIGRGFRNTNLCPGYGDPCTVASACTGVRDVDWGNRASNTPHDILWIDNAANCGSGPAPCGGGVHCEGSVYAESVWDLWNRDLTAPPFAYDLDRAREVATHLTYAGAGSVTTWYSCDVTGPFDGGCGATAGYMQYLGADDDNGNLADGTPHMTAIFAAFDRHKVACQAPAAVNSGCAGAPAAAPVVVAAPVDKGVNLTWGAIAGATEYEVFRTDGVFGCNFGKIKVGTTTGLSFADSGLQNGRTYSYQVIAKGASDSCFGPASACTTGVPVPGASLATLPTSSLLQVFSGDSDAFLDNCEVLKITMPVSNTGTSSLTNVQVVSASSTSHPSSTLLTTLPKSIAASLPSCGSDAAVLEFQVQGLVAGDEFEIEMEISATELVGTQTISVSAAALATEGDFQSTPTQTWSYTADAQGWVTEGGTFVRSNSGPGTPGNTGFFFQSSSNLANQCDTIASPLVRLSSTSTLSLTNHFDIEPFYAPSSSWYDRANVAFRETATQGLTVLNPDSGRMYNASGPNGPCGIGTQPGWAGTFTSWAASNWTSAAMQTGTLAAKPGNLVIRYGTDPALNPNGFRFDEVTLTNFDLAVADGQSNTCSASNLIFADGFASGNTGEWSSTAP